MSERVPNEEARQRIDARRRRRAKGSRQTKMFLAFIAIVCIVLAGAGVYYMQIDNSIRAKDEQLLSTLRTHAEDEPFYMLLLGVDKGEERATDEGYGQDVSNYRADTIMLARIDPKNVKATLVSVHRDTYVENAYAENGYCKINAIYSLLGPAGMVEEVSELASVGINHYAEIDFDAFIGIVDVIGGVEVTLPVDVYDPDYTKLDLKAGTHLLNGHDALMLCRCRHGYDAYGDGDRFRAANQRMVFSEVIKKVLASDPATMMNTVSAIADCVTTDLGIAEILDLASQMMTLNVETDIMTGMEPTDGVLIEDGWYEICLVDQWKKMMTRVDQGLPPYDETEGEHDSTAGIAGGVGEEGARAAEAAGTPEYVEPTLSSDTSSGYDGNGYGDAGGYAYDYSTTYYDGGDYSGDTGYTEEYVDYSEGGEVASEEVSYDESGGGGEEVATEEYTGQ